VSSHEAPRFAVGSSFGASAQETLKARRSAELPGDTPCLKNWRMPREESEPFRETHSGHRRSKARRERGRSGTSRSSPLRRASVARFRPFVAGAEPRSSRRRCSGSSRLSSLHLDSNDRGRGWVLVLARHRLDWSLRREGELEGTVIACLHRSSARLHDHQLRSRAAPLLARYELTGALRTK
jgi:hypothetical protein